MESPESDDVFSESWQNCGLVGPVKKLNDEQINFPRENPMLSPKNTASNETNITLNIKKENLQSHLVIPKNRLPIVVKTENDVNVDRPNDYMSEEDDYFIEESQNEVKFSPKIHVEIKPSVTDSEEEESLSTFKNTNSDEKAIKEEYSVESKPIIQEELDIKVEDEAEDQFTAKSEVDQIEKWNHSESETAPLNRLSTNNGRFHLTEPPVFKCPNCTYQTHRKENIARHVLSHKTLECSHCTDKTKNKYHFSHHQLAHVPKEQVKLYQCPECSFTSIRKYGLTQHMIKHMPIHKKDRPMHKCTLCCHETPRKYDLTKHMRNVHRPKVIQPIHCQEEGCSFKTHHKSNLARHIRIIHECKRVFKCSICSYQTKYVDGIKAHELRHQGRNKWFSCTLCPHKTISRTHLKNHMLVHKSGSEITWFHCSQCPFKTKRNYTLKLHALIHNLNPAKILKCSECSYKAIRVNNLRRHQLVHKVSEWFYCYLCTLRTKHKTYLVKHIRKMHRGSDGRLNDS